MSKGGRTVKPIVSSIEIARPPEVVFSYVTDPMRFAEWQYDVVNVRMEGGRPPGVGSRFTTTRRIGRAERTMTQEITQSSPPTSWAAHGVAGPIRPNANITIEPLNDSTRSRVTFALDFEGHGAGVPLVPVVRRMAAKGAPTSYRNLKERLEGAASHASAQLKDIR
jgi:uncharacterized protein YndB with AHSA1/START domain